MAALLLPTGQGAPLYRYRITLEGREYDIRGTWNEQAESWMLDIYDADGQLLRGGVRVVKEWPLLARGADDRLPPGDLIATDASRDGLELVYLESGE